MYVSIPQAGFIYLKAQVRSTQSCLADCFNPASGFHLFESLTQIIEQIKSEMFQSRKRVSFI